MKPHINWTVCLVQMLSTTERFPTGPTQRVYLDIQLPSFSIHFLTAAGTVIAFSIVSAKINVPAIS